MTEYTVIYEPGESNWSAYVPDLPGCIATAKTRKRIERRIQEAIEVHIEGLRLHTNQSLSLRSKLDESRFHHDLHGSGVRQLRNGSRSDEPRAENHERCRTRTYLMRKLPLRSFQLKNFKAVRDSKPVKFGPLTVFIGNNGSGKSSIIEGLETYCRKLAQEGNELYILCGHGFDNGAQRAKTIGSEGIAVPDFGWKIVLALPEKSGDDLARIDENTRVIAVKMENSRSISGPGTTLSPQRAS